MSAGMNPLLIIPARAGSQRIPNKNRTLLAGMSPLQRAIACCRTAFPQGADIIVTADQLPNTEWQYGVRYHPRSAFLSSDTASMVDVVLDVLRVYPGSVDQRVLLVQPTQPLRKPEHLIEAYVRLEAHPSVASLAETVSVDKLYLRRDGRLVPVGGALERDQQATPTFACDGTVYGFRRDWFLKHQTFRDVDHTSTFVIPPDETCRLDTEMDWRIASLLLAHRGH